MYEGRLGQNVTVRASTSRIYPWLCSPEVTDVRFLVAIGGKADLPSHSRKLTSWGKIGVPQVLTEEALMKRIALAFLITAFAVGSASAQTCATKAMSKDGKPLAGAAKTSFVKKCCEDSAVSKDGKPLSGAAKNSHVTKCMKDG